MKNNPIFLDFKLNLQNIKNVLLWSSLINKRTGKGDVNTSQIKSTSMLIKYQSKMYSVRECV